METTVKIKTSYFEMITKILPAVKNNKYLFNKELIKGMYLMESNDEDSEDLLEWAEQQLKTIH